jgi:hypothetical protein
LTVSFNGTNAGQPNTWTNTYVMFASKDATSRQLTIDTSADTSVPASIVIAEVGGVLYDKRGDTPCTANRIDPAASPGSPADLYQPAAMLPAIIGADAFGADDVNGVPTNHYTFDENEYNLASRTPHPCTK